MRYYTTKISLYSIPFLLVQNNEEINIEEWQLPEPKREPMDVDGYGIQPDMHTDRNIPNVDNGPGSSEVILRGPDLPVKQEQSEPLFDDANQSMVSSELKNFLSLEASEETARNSFEGESICTPQDNSIEMRDTNKGGIHEEDLRGHDVPEEESAGLSKSVLNNTESEPSLLKSPYSMSKLVCDICKKSSKTKQDLGKHIRIHYDERPFSCNICDKTFKHYNARDLHELRHVRDKMKFGKNGKGSKKRRYSCAICSKKFISKIGLNWHSNSHSNKFKCNTCGKCFGSNNDLRRHLRSHTKEKPFKCEVCLKCFSRKSTLNAHLRIHSSEKPYSCEFCDKRFMRNQVKNVHELRHLRKK